MNNKTFSSKQLEAVSKILQEHLSVEPILEKESFDADKFNKRVRTVVEELGYSFNAKPPVDKGAWLFRLANLEDLFVGNDKLDFLPNIVVTFGAHYEELKDVALMFIDTAQLNNGILKLVDASISPLTHDYHIPYLQNLIYHQAFPSEDKLKFPDISEDDMDEMQDHWEDYVQLVSYTEWENNNHSWFPIDYHNLPPKDGFYLQELGFRIRTWGDGAHDPDVDNIFNHYKGPFEGRVVRLEDLKISQVDYTLTADEIPSDRKGEGEYYRIKDKKAVVISLTSDLRPTVIDATGDIVYVPLVQNGMAIIDDPDVFDAEYLARELQKDYVKKQIEDKQRTIMYIKDDREYALYLVKIYLPSERDGLSSIERQKVYVQKDHSSYVKYLEEELEKERARYLAKYKEICDYCKEERLKRLLIKLEKDEISNDTTIFNEIRQLLEWVKQKSPAELSKYRELSLSEYSRALNDDKTIPEYIKRSFHTCVRIGHEGSHYGDNKRNAPYLTKSLIYCLLNILDWCKDLEKKNLNV